MAFQKAVKRKLKARVAICGPTGSGKTFTGLRLLRALVGPQGKLAVIDTENRTAAKYLGDAIDDFDVDEFDTFSPERYVKAIREAAKAGYDGLLVDSLTHAWSGKDGALEQVDAAARRQAARSGGKENNFAAWRDVTPMHNELVETMIRFPGHLVVTMRSKMAYEQVDGKIRKLGMAPIQRDGVEYEFDVVGDVDVDHVFVISKTRCRAIDGKTFKKPSGEDIATPLLAWLDDGAEEKKEDPAPTAAAANQAVALKAKAAFQRAKSELGMTLEEWKKEIVAALGSEKPSGEWTQEDCDKVVNYVWPKKEA
jgi:hypothetical protein